HPRTREIRLRNTAKRQGLELVKSRRRDPRAIGFGCWCVRSRWGERVMAWCGGGLALVEAPARGGGAERFGAWVTLDVIERLLTDGTEKPERPAPTETGGEAVTRGLAGRAG